MNIFLLEDENFDTAGNAWITKNDQYTHACRVLAVQVGDVVKIGRKNSNIGTAKVAQIDQSQILLTAVSLDISPPKKLGVTVVLALPRPKVLRRLMMDMTAMGVNHIVLINSYRTDKSYWQSVQLERIDEFIYEGLQQAVDTVPPTVTLAKRFKPFVQDVLPSMITQNSAVVLHPYSELSFGDFSCQQLPKLMVIGAGGGFINYEVDLLASIGVTAVSLGERILRTESAVNAVLGRWLC